MTKQGLGTKATLLVVAAAIVAPANCLDSSGERGLRGLQTDVDFCGRFTIGFGDFEKGDTIDENIAFPQGVTIQARRWGRGQTAFPHGLVISHQHTRNQGLGNFPSLGNVFIIAEDEFNDRSSKNGGQVKIDFPINVTLHSIRFVDVENSENGDDGKSELGLFDEAGTKIRGVKIPGMQSGGQKIMAFRQEQMGMRSIMMNLRGTAAIDDIVFSLDDCTSPVLEVGVGSCQTVGVGDKVAGCEITGALVRTIVNRRSRADLCSRTCRRDKVATSSWLAYNRRSSRLVDSYDDRFSVWNVNPRITESGETHPHNFGFPPFRSGTQLQAAYSPDFRLIAFLSQGNIYDADELESKSGPVRIAPLVSLKRSGRQVFQRLAWHPSSEMILTGDRRGTIELRSVADGTVIQTFSRFVSKYQNTQSLSFSPDGTQFVSGALPSRYLVWNLSTAEIIHDLREGTDAIDSKDAIVEYSRDGSIIATSATDGWLRAFDAHSGEFLHRINSEEANNFEARLSFSPNGKYLAVLHPQDSKLRVWDPYRGPSEPVLVLKVDDRGRPTSTQAFAWSPNGRFIAIGKRFLEIKIFEITEHV